jgi:uncharacterized protein YkwD
MYQAGKNVPRTIRCMATLSLLAVSILFALVRPCAYAEASSYANPDLSRFNRELIGTKALADKSAAKQIKANTLTFYGQSKAVANTFDYGQDKLATNSALTMINSLIPSAKIVSFKAKDDLLSNMQSVDYLLIRKDAAVYASAKQIQSTVASVVSKSVVGQPQIVQGEVKGEAVEANAHNLNADLLLNLVNQHRVNIGLQPLQKDDRVMQIASERTPELFDEIFVNNNMHAGFYSRNLPYAAVENIIYYNTEEGAFQWWLNSPLHRAAIENPTYTYTGIACSGRFCSMIYTSFQPK